MKCQEPWWITLMIKYVFWVTAVKSGHGRTECNMATTCPCRHRCSGVKATQVFRVNTPDKTLPHWWNAKSPSEKNQAGAFSSLAGDCRLPLSASVTLLPVQHCSSNAQTERGFSLATSLLPCCFIHRAQGSFAKSSVVDLRRQTVLQIHQNSVSLNDILLCRLANHKENSGGSVLKPRVFGQISCSVSRRDPLKCLLSSRGPSEEMLLSFTQTQSDTHMRAFTHKHKPIESWLMVGRALNNTLLCVLPVAYQWQWWWESLCRFSGAGLMSQQQDYLGEPMKAY